MRHSGKSLYHAYRWSIYAGVSEIIGFALRHDSSSAMWPLGGVLIIAGLFFAFIAVGLALLGFAVPGGASRRSFWVPLLVALPPLIFPILELLKR